MAAAPPARRGSALYSSAYVAPQISLSASSLPLGLMGFGPGGYSSTPASAWLRTTSWCEWSRAHAAFCLIRVPQILFFSDFRCPHEVLPVRRAGVERWACTIWYWSGEPVPDWWVDGVHDCTLVPLTHRAEARAGECG